MHETHLLSLIVSDFVCHMCDGGDLWLNLGFIWVYLIIIDYCQQIASEFIIIIYVFLIIGICVDSYCWFTCAFIYFSLFYFVSLFF